VRPRDRVAAGDAVATLLRKDAGAEMRRCASATLASLGVDEYAAVADARARTAPGGVPGALRKDAGGEAVEITLRKDIGGGRVLRMEMTTDEAVGLVSAVQGALRGAR